uniref:Uncharacterized protein n=1 Tax=Magallana gigas TaxID=29159 RepID=K1QEB3_MAGGI
MLKHLDEELVLEAQLKRLKAQREMKMAESELSVLKEDPRLQELAPSLSKIYLENLFLDLFVSEEELMELDRDICPLWQEGGMRCPADGCNVFPECMAKCRRHWAEIHTEYIHGFQCTMCRFAPMRRNQIIRHMGRVHPNQPTEGLELRTFSNRKYSNPGNGLMQICEIFGRQFRDQEAKRQRSLVAGIETPLVKEDTNSCDQVVFAYDTETVIVTKKLWGPNSKEKVVRLKNC